MSLPESFDEAAREVSHTTITEKQQHDGAEGNGRADQDDLEPEVAGKESIDTLDSQEPKEQKHVAEGEAIEAHPSVPTLSAEEANKSDETDKGDDDDAPEDLLAANSEKPIKRNSDTSSNECIKVQKVAPGDVTMAREIHTLRKSVEDMTLQANANGHDAVNHPPDDLSPIPLSSSNQTETFDLSNDDIEKLASSFDTSSLADSISPKVTNPVANLPTRTSKEAIEDEDVSQNNSQAVKVSDVIFKRSKIALGNEGMDSEFKNDGCPDSSFPIHDTGLASASLKSGCCKILDEKVGAAVKSHLFDGCWRISWESYPMDSNIISIQENSFVMFGFPWRIELGGPNEDYNPIVEWPLEFLSSNTTPIVQKSNLIIPPGMTREELPTQIQWTTTNTNYGKIIWKKLDDSGVGGQDLEKALQKGKAWLLAEGAASLQNDDIKIIAQDDMMFLTERLLMAREEFKRKNIPIDVDIAYHHTRSENLATIRTNGLLSLKEREQQGIFSKYNGSAFGDGIYCALDPSKYANTRYGDTTILLARMKGIETDMQMKFRRGWRKNSYLRVWEHRRSAVDCNTLNVGTRFCVLQSSSQCVPLFQFPSKLLAENLRDGVLSDFLDRLADFQKSVQALLDKIFDQHVLAGIYSSQDIMHNIWKQGSPGGLWNTLEIQRQSIRRQARINILKKMNLCRKENFEMFTQVLTKHLEQKDWVMYSQANSIIRDCTERNKQQEAGYENVTIPMESRLKELVGERHWKTANVHFFHSIEQKKKQASILNQQQREQSRGDSDYTCVDGFSPRLEERFAEKSFYGHLTQGIEEKELSTAGLPRSTISSKR